MPLGEADARTIFHWLSPDYLIPAAEEHGQGDRVRGAYGAYREVRAMISEYSRYVAWRDDEPRANQGLGWALRAMGYLGGPQVLGEQVHADWRATAEATFTDASCAMMGECEVEIPSGSGPILQQKVNLAAMMAISRMLTFHAERLNRARLDGRVFQRFSPEILVHAEVEVDELRSVLVSPARVAPDRWRRTWLRALRGLTKLEAHWLRPLASQLLRAWGASGFINSPAGAMVSLVGSAGVPRGYAPLFPANGIPLAFTVGRARGGRCVIGMTADHRVVDGVACGLAYDYLEKEVPRCLERLGSARRGRSKSDRPRGASNSSTPSSSPSSGKEQTSAAMRPATSS